MFNNYINIHDLLLLREKGPKILGMFWTRIFKNKKDRTKETWSSAKAAPKNWWDIPYVQERWNLLVSGESDVDYYAYLASKYLSGNAGLKALSLGCGVGHRELSWVETGKFSGIDAYDLSEGRIRAAAQLASEKGYGDVIDYRVGDVYNIEMRENYYDVVFGEQSLHHFTPLEEILLRVEKFIKPGGYFIVNEFVGPTKFQWTDRQLQAVNGLLAILPERYKRLHHNGRIKTNVYRPGRLRMHVMDPSEAVESAQIEPLLNQIFEVVEVKPYGGTLLHLLFNGIAQNFLPADKEARAWLDLCFSVEDQLLASNDIKSDYIVAVYKKKFASR